jgi:hypothetical protein
MTATEDTNKDMVINETMRMWEDKSFPKEFNFNIHTTKIEKLKTLRLFREFWFAKWQYTKDMALKEFFNPDEKIN